MLTYEKAEHMSRHQLDMVNAALDVVDDENMLIMNQAFHGKGKK